MKKLTVVDKFKSLLREATEEDVRVMTIVLDLMYPKPMEPRKPQSRSQAKRVAAQAKLSPADSAKMQQDVKDAG